MKKSIILTGIAAMVIVPIFLLAVSINENKAEQKIINSGPDIALFEARSSEWAEHFPIQYESFVQTRYNYEIVSLLARYPALVVMWAGFGFSRDYNATRGHFYMLDDNINTLRTGSPVDDQTGPMPTACWACKSSDVPRLIAEYGEYGFFTGRWARFGDEAVNPLGCIDCHNSETMELTLTRPFLVRALDTLDTLPSYKDATNNDMRSLVCAQCHSEYYFKPTEWTDDAGNIQIATVVTFPWSEGTTVEDMERYYDDRNFADWVHPISRARMLKSQHPDYELFKTGIHAMQGVSCADCHMPDVFADGTKYSFHNIRSPLKNMGKSCMTCHRGSEEDLRENVERKRERVAELSHKAMHLLATLHLEAGKAWELGATEEEMAEILMGIRHAQWRWDYAASSHGGFFHAPEEMLRIIASGINKAHETRFKLRKVLASYGAIDYVAPDFSTKEKAQKIIGLPFDEIVKDKMMFHNTLRKEWEQEAKDKGRWDPKARDGVEFRTSYSEKL